MTSVINTLIRDKQFRSKFPTIYHRTEFDLNLEVKKKKILFPFFQLASHFILAQRFARKGNISRNVSFNGYRIRQPSSIDSVDIRSRWSRTIPSYSCNGNERIN